MRRANLPFLSLVHKARKPKFEVHLKIADLNNVPLVSGVSMVKWHLPGSIHGEHRGRTDKCPIVNHRVEYGYAKIFPVRIAIDRNNSLCECPIEFEVHQEFSATGVAGVGSRDEKITLGIVRLNLSEYVEESEAILRDTATAAAIKEALTSSGRTEKPGHHRRRSSVSESTIPTIGSDPSPRSSRDDDSPPSLPATDVQDGVVRRYLMQDSKINSTLKISILMVQVDGDKNFVAPPPKSAPVFGGIAGFVASDAFEPVDVNTVTPGHAPSSFSGKYRDLSEAQDVYRRALAASWASQPGELPADQCIEDIFAGGEGFPPPPNPKTHGRGHSRHHLSIAGHLHGQDRPRKSRARRNRPPSRREDSGSASDDEDNGTDVMGTVRARDLVNLRRHMSSHSLASERSTTTVATVLARDHNSGPDRESSHERPRGGLGAGFSASSSSLHQREPFPPFPSFFQHRREESKITHDGGLRSRTGSLASLANTVGSDKGYDSRGRDGFKRAREVDEFEIREDLIAWTVPGAMAHL